MDPDCNRYGYSDSNANTTFWHADTTPYCHPSEAHSSTETPTIASAAADARIARKVLTRPPRLQ